MVRAIAVTFLWVTIVGSPGAEVQSEVSIDLSNSLVFGADHLSDTDEDSGDEVAAGGTGTAQLDLRNTGSRDVRSWFQLRTTLARDPEGSATTFVDVPRAEIRWRMTAGEDYTIRYTVGRTRLSWGDGVLYNAGDVLNGAAPDRVDLTATTLREETLWMVAAYLPMGRFSFVEPVVLFPMAPVPRPASEIGAGGRIQGQIAEMKSEAGYLYRGTTGDHRPYISLQGNLIVDWYAGASWSSAAEEGVISGGLLYNGTSDRFGSWSARTEALWERAGSEVALFPEVTWSPSRLFSVVLRLQTTTEAEEATATAGVRWTPSTGLTLSLYGVGDTGQEIGTITAGVSHVF